MLRYAVPNAPEGCGYGLVTDRFALVVDGAAGIDTVLQLWEALSAEDAAFEDPLLVIAGLGVGLMPDFALIERTDADAVALAVRGRGFARLGDAGPSYRGAGTEPWVEASAPHVPAFTIGLGASAPGASSLPLGKGVVRTDEVRAGASPAPRTHATVSLDLSDEDTVLGLLRRRRTEPADAADETILGSRRAAPTPAPVAPAPAVAAAPAALHFALVFDSGQVLPLDATPVIVGRAPRVPAGSAARPEPLRSPTRSVSGTHAELRLQGAALLVTDLDSTNGTVVDTGQTAPLVLRHGAAARLSPGDRVDFGDGNAAVFGPAPNP